MPIIAQGFEAGGHTGRFLGSDPAEAMGLFALLPQVVDAVRVPVIAAGGIADARGIAAAFTLGASAVQLGTAYLHAPEARDQRRASRQPEATAGRSFTNLMTGGLARGLHGRLIDELGAGPRRGPALSARQRSARADPHGGGAAGRIWLRPDVGRAGGAARQRAAGRRADPQARRRRAGDPRRAERRARRMEIVAVPAFTDNYIWLVHDEASGETAVVDPGDAAPALAEAERRGWTHHPGLEHAPSLGPFRRQCRDEGSDRLHASPGPAAEDIPGRDVALSEGDARCASAIMSGG